MFAQLEEGNNQGSNADIDFGSYIQNLRDSRVGSFVRPLQAAASGSGDTFQLSDRLSQFQKPVAGLGNRPQASGSMFGMNRSKASSSFGKGNFRPTMLVNVQEDDE